MIDRISVRELTVVGIEALRRSGAPAAHAEMVVSQLLANDQDGYSSHGILQLPRYLANIKAGEILPESLPIRISQSDTLVRIEGNKAFGCLVTDVIVDELSTRASRHGLAAAFINGGQHLGRLGLFARRLASSPHLISTVGFFNFGGMGRRVARPGDFTGTLCTNPIVVGVPVASGEPFVLDMSTSVVSEGTVLMASEGGRPAEQGWLISSGSTCEDAASLYRDECPSTLAPLGYPFAGHKGFGLALAAELLAGAVAGGANVAFPAMNGNSGVVFAIATVGGTEVGERALQIIEAVLPSGSRRPGTGRATPSDKTSISVPRNLLEHIRAAASI